jgi:putative RNA 2'-phosphotransferase
LQLDAEGWTSFEELIIAIRFERHEWAWLDESKIMAAIAEMDRFEIREGKIRAVYGHSIALARPPAIATPPDVLYHGTSADNVPNILKHGILRMRRQLAHLSSDYEWVVRFLDDKATWTILAIKSSAALNAGVSFRKANHHVWLTDEIQPGFLDIHSEGHRLLAQQCPPSFG